MKPSFVRTLRAGALVLVALAGPAAATLLADWDLDELARRADLIVVGTVEAQVTVVPTDKRVVLTESTIRVERTLLGAPRATFVLSQLGGRKGSVVTEIVGDARLAEGDKVLLFTFEHEDKRRYLVGMALGAWFLGEEPGVLEQTVTASLVDAQGQLREGPGLRQATLADVEAAIARQAAAGSPATSLGAEESVKAAGLEDGPGSEAPLAPSEPPAAEPGPWREPAPGGEGASTSDGEGPEAVP